MLVFVLCVVFCGGFVWLWCYWWLGVFCCDWWLGLLFWWLFDFVLGCFRCWWSLVCVVFFGWLDDYFLLIFWYINVWVSWLYLVRWCWSWMLFVLLSCCCEWDCCLVICFCWVRWLLWYDGCLLVFRCGWFRDSWIVCLWWWLFRMGIDSEWCFNSFFYCWGFGKCLIWFFSWFLWCWI